MTDIAELGKEGRPSCGGPAAADTTVLIQLVIGNCGGPEVILGTVDTEVEVNS